MGYFTLVFLLFLSGLKNTLVEFIRCFSTLLRIAEQQQPVFYEYASGGEHGPTKALYPAAALRTLITSTSLGSPTRCRWRLWRPVANLPEAARPRRYCASHCYF
uniref:Secreted protein n=1 Tax=Vespula pensylvanica TaxID=30213 RepID=A0A834PA57_VESPE|nr:hypothetical protein H0235_002467 [Vespula pensylvanica]